MGGEGFTSAMISSIKNNSRRKKKHFPFSENGEKYKKGKAVLSKEFTQLEKDLLAKEIKENLELENKQRVYKLIITFTLTVIFIIGFVTILRFIFF